ncbi:MAG: TonB-dependent receptor [Alphaproteobacteria bacterium]
MKYATLVSAIALLPAAAVAQNDPRPVAETEVIEILAVPYGADSESLTQGVSILQGNELERRLEGSIGETLFGLPGVSSTFFGPASSRPIIRGQSGPRVRVLIGGIGSIDASSVSPDHAVAGEGLAIEKVEVIRGPSTLLYGPNAIGGVVNILDGRIPTEMPEDGVEGAVRTFFGTNANEFGAAASVTAGLGDRLAIHLDGFYREGDDYRVPLGAILEDDDHDDDHGHDDDYDEDHDAHDDDHDHEDEENPRRVENSDFETKSGTAGLSYIGDSGFLGVSVTVLDSNYGIPGGHGHGHEGEHDDDHGDDHDDGHEDDDEHGHGKGDEEEETVRIDLEQVRVDVMGGLDTDFLIFKETKFRFGWADYEHVELEGGEVGTLFTNKGWEGRLDLVQDDSGAWSGGMGLNVLKRNFSAVGAEAFTPPSETTKWGLFTAQEVDLGDIVLQGGLRYDHTKVNPETADPTRSFDQISASVGAIWQAADPLRLTVHLSRTERAPTAEELFSNGPHLATNGFEVGDPTLGKETANSAELGVHVHSGPFDLEASVYYTAYNDFIFLSNTGAEEDGLPVRAYGQHNATFYGMELAAQVELMTGLIARGQLDWVRAKIDPTDEPLPRIPPLRVTAGLDYSANQFDVGAEVQFVDSQNRVAALEEPTDDYTLLNAYLTWRPFSNVEGVSFSVRGRNLLNKIARNHSSFIKEDAPLPGRDVRFSLNIDL